MNELYFFLHILLILFLLLFALKLGREALISLFSLLLLLSNLFVTKQMECFGLTITCCDVYTIGSLFTLNFLQEKYGKKMARKAIWISFFLLLTFILMAKIHLLYIPSPVDTKHSAFLSILATTPRIMAVSFFVSFCTDFLDAEVYSLLRKAVGEKALLCRLGVTALFTQLLDTFLFSYLALYGLVHSIGEIIMMSYLVKVGTILIITSTLSPLKRFMKREEVA